MAGSSLPANTLTRTRPVSGVQFKKKKTYYERGRRCENGGDIAEGGHGGGKNGKIKLYHKWRRRCESGGDVAKGGHGGGN
jgi:hypothetical protein